MRKKVKKLERFFESIINNMTEGVVVQDADGVIIFVNPATLDLLGYEFEELVGQDWRITCPPDQHRIIEKADRLRKDGKSSRYEVELLRRDGTRVPVLVSGSPRYEGKEFAGSLAVFTDITMQKRLQQEAIRRAAQADLIYRVGQRISGELDLESLLAEIVRAVRDSFDYYGVMLLICDEKKKRLKLQSIVGGYCDIFPKDLTVKLGEGMIGQAAVTGKTQISGDVSKNHYYIRLSDEETKSELAIPIFSQGRVIGVLDIQSDKLNDFSKADVEAMETLSTQIGTAIRNASLYKQLKTEIDFRKRKEEALKKSEKKYRTLFNAIADPVVIFDKKSYRFLDCNRAVQRIYGYSLEELRKMTPFDLHPPEEIERVKRSIDVRNIDYSFSYSHMTKDGRRLYVDIHSDEIYYQGRAAWISVIRDVTARRMLEEQLKEFAYVASHDLKSPLRAINQLAEWISRDYRKVLDEDGREKLRLLQQRVRRMNNLITAIFEYSKASRKMRKADMVDCNKIVDEVISSISIPDDFNIKIKCKLPTIHAERVKIYQLFQNLISNAVKFNDKENGELEIRCTEKNGYWQFVFADNGPGIEKRYHEKIFKVFQTLESRDTQESTGIGLSIVKRIVEQNGGKVWVESEPGKGSRFYITIKKE